MVGEMEERKALGVSMAGGGGGGWEKISGEERKGVAETGGGGGGGGGDGGEGRGAGGGTCCASGGGDCPPGCGDEEKGFHQTMTDRRVGRVLRAKGGLAVVSGKSGWPLLLLVRLGVCVWVPIRFSVPTPPRPIGIGTHGGPEGADRKGRTGQEAQAERRTRDGVTQETPTAPHPRTGQMRTATLRQSSITHAQAQGSGSG